MGETLNTSLHSARGELAGQLYITAPSDFGRNMLLEWIDEFIEQHPRVTIKLDLSDSLTDMYSKPVDLAIRYGEPADSNLVAIPLCRSNERILCASPDYLASQPPILHPSDLLQHNCLCYMVSGAIYNKWSLQKDGHHRQCNRRHVRF